MQQGGRPRTATSVKSRRSLISASHSLVLALKGSRLIDYAKLSLLVLPPLFVVMALCGLSLKSVKTAIDFQSALEENVRAAQGIGELVTRLQRERGMTCFYISTFSSGNETLENETHTKLQRFRNDTDTTLSQLDVWLGDVSDGLKFENKTIFHQTLTEYRASVTSNVSSCDLNIQFYTEIDETLLKEMNSAFRGTEDGAFWAAVESYHAVLIAKDFFGLQRALGGSFFAQGRFPDMQEYAHFAKVTGAANRLLSTALHLAPQAEEHYKQMKREYASLISSLDEFTKEIFRYGITNSTADSSKSIVWFSNMTTFLSTVITGVEHNISSFIFDALTKKLKRKNLEMHLTISTVVAVLLLCPPLTAWYAMQSRKLMRKLKVFTDKLIQKSKELTLEKKRTDLLLYQLLPKSIVNDLKQNKPVCPEHYESATIYFSDIQGFTALCAKSTPLQVVDLLNKLYTKCDNVLDQYDVYKVETIGDAYMVVSGVPKRNGDKHSAEVASMALNVLMEMEEFTIPHMQQQRLLMRIGIHTGPVAAGVVGTKMPRYCLFGETVSIASKMESTGLALRIQLSQQTSEHLERAHTDVFETSRRETLEIQENDEMVTYWLLAKRDYPYRIDIGRADSVANQST